jgi:hypothetical protein
MHPCFGPKVIANRSRYYEMRGGSMNKRIQFITHLGKQILLINLSNCLARVVIGTSGNGTARAVNDYAVFEEFQKEIRIMADKAIERSACRFSAALTGDGKQGIAWSCFVTRCPR